MMVLTLMFIWFMEKNNMRKLLLILCILPFFVSGQHHMMHTLAGQSTGGSFTSTPWDITNLVLEDSLTLPANIDTGDDLYISTDGIYLSIKETDNNLHRYILSTAWSISSAGSLSSSITTTGKGIYLRSNGMAVYFISANDSLKQYNYNTAWSPPSNSYYDGFYIGTQNINPTSVSIKDSDGTKVYVTGYYSTDEINLYTMSTGWNLKTISYTAVTNIINTYETTNTGIFVRQDNGTSIYTIGITNDKVHLFSTSTAWTLTGIAYVSSSVDLKTISYITTPSGVFFSSDGTKMYVIDDSRDKIYQFKLGY